MCFQSLKLNLDFGFTTAFGFSSIVLGAISFIPAGAGVTEVHLVQLLSHYGVEISETAACCSFGEIDKYVVLNIFRDCSHQVSSQETVS